jgi:predicted alpha-1,2-mannosidase
MNPIQFKNLHVIAIIIMMVQFSACNQENPLDYVDPAIGNVGLILEPTRPTVQLPNQFIRVYPNRKDYLDDQISSFPLTLISHRNGQLFRIMPFTVDNADYSNLKSAWDQGNEVTTPYYYSVMLRDFDTFLEFVPGAKSGIFRISFPAGNEKHLLLSIVNGGDWKKISGSSFSGTEEFNAMKAFVYAEVDKPAYYDGLANKDPQESEAIISWSDSTALTVEFRYAVSLISSEQAKLNFQKEIEGKDFEEVKSFARESWENVLGQIQVKGGSDASKRTFYTALYRCYERMVNITEDGMYYSNYDSTVHDAGSHDFYIDDWAWDTYLVHHPLRCILDPDLEADMITSYIRMYEQSGWLPTFPILWGDVPCMNGFHSTVMILDAYRKGITDFNLELAFEGMKKNALQATMLPWRNGPACSLDKFYHQNGFYPALHPGETETEPLVHPFEKRQSVAITLGHSYDDWALARVAELIGKKEDAELFDNKALNYKNVYHPEKAFFLPKDAKGEWIGIDPAFDGGMGGRDYYDENNGWTYLWQVQHDIYGLMELMGGEKAFTKRLDQLFREELGRSKYELWARFPDFTGITGQFSMGNEPSFHIPYLYNFTSSPWKTQRRIRSLIDNWFPDNIFGIPGDEDGGGMSAFVVFTSMGFYPVVPGIPVYTIGSPVFNEISIALPNGKRFRIVAENNSKENVYIQKAILNNKELTGPWFQHDDLLKGGELRLEMGSSPNKEWGKNNAFSN